VFIENLLTLRKRLLQKGEKVHNDKTIKKVADLLAGASKAHAKQSKMLRKVLASPLPKRKNNKSKK
jgi:hypothetical protein